jgi:hypothetical protein
MLASAEATWLGSIGFEKMPTISNPSGSAPTARYEYGPSGPASGCFFSSIRNSR